MHDNETIVAIATPPGRGGIGIVRLSGSEARRIVDPILQVRHPLEAGHARFAYVLDPESGSRIDEAIVTYFAAPRSYTGEDVVEIAAHGAPVILSFIVQQALVAGAQLADPGEFTQRAFLNGRLDLTQAEAVRDLIEAQTLYQARVAAQQIDGSLSRIVHPVKQRLIETIAILEAGIDFAEDDIAVIEKEELQDRLLRLLSQLQPIVESYRQGRIVHSGLTLAIVGKTNAGKSSLFNRLLQRERAIVTAQPGTTRDLVTEGFSLDGIPIHMVDTAGLRQTEDEAEKIGIQKSREILAEADVVLYVMDVTKSILEEEQQVLEELRMRPAILVLNKTDLVSKPSQAEARMPAMKPSASQSSVQADAIDNFSQKQFRIVSISALTGAGVEDLKREILSIAGGGPMNCELGMITNLRQAQAVGEALASLDGASVAVNQDTPHEMVLLDLYSALKQLDSLTGETTTDDILNLIFSSFCIGK